MKLYYLFCNGSRGDCEPAVSLAQYMIVKGNRVRIYSNQKNKKFLEKSEIDHNIILKNYIFRQPEEVTSLEYYDEFKNSIIYHIDLINSIDEKPDVVIGMQRNFLSHIINWFYNIIRHLTTQAIRLLLKIFWRH